MPDPITNELKNTLKLMDHENQDEEIAKMHPDEFRKMVAAKLQTIVNNLADRIHAETSNMPISKLPLAYGIMQDKLHTLQGEATIRTQKTITVNHQDFNAILAALPAKPAIDEISENPSPMSVTQKKKGG